MNKFLLYRARLGITQQELARRAGVGTVTISNLEHGRRRNVRPRTIGKIASVLGADIEDLMDEAREPELEEV